MDSVVEIENIMDSEIHTARASTSVVEIHTAPASTPVVEIRTPQIPPASTSIIGTTPAVTEHPSLTFIKGTLTHLSSKSSEVCIYEIPENIRKLNPDSYSPTFVSIGPFHAHRNNLIFNSLKPYFLKELLDRCEVSIEQVFETLLPLEDSARKFYANPIALSPNEFIILLVNDACFIFNYIFKVQDNSGTPQPNNLWKQFREDITSDLLLLENQLPYFILKSLYSLISENLNEESLVCCINEFLLQRQPDFPISTIPSKFSHIGHHLLDFRRLQLCHDKPSDVITNGSSCFPYTVTELHKCGVSFEVNTATFVLDVSFDDSTGSLKLPQLTIYKGFETHMMNLIGYEQCHKRDHQSEVGNFAVLMQFLVKTNEDVDLLIKYDIIKNNLSTVSEVTKVFNKIAKHVLVDNGSVSYSRECERMLKFCQKRRHRWFTSLKDNYFSSPWAGTATIGAIIIILLSMVQTIASLISLKK